MNSIINKSVTKSVQIAMLLVMGGVVSLSGCSSNSNSPEVTSLTASYSCSLPQSKQLTVAIEESRATLQHRSCQGEYAAHFDSLVTIASGSPRMSNMDSLGLQSKWMVNHGLLSSKDGEAMLRRYFSPQLVSLEYDNDFNTYSHCSMGSQQTKINKALEQELEQKRKGLSGALGDNKSYQMALKEYQSVQLLLSSSQQACQQAQY